MKFAMDKANNLFLPQKARLTCVNPLTTDNYLFQFQTEDPQLPSKLMPGQFVQLYIPGVGEAPISVCSSGDSSHIELCVRRVGRVTNALFQLEEGAVVGIRGPFGNGFPLEKYYGQNVVLIAGGLGVAPIRSLWQYIFNHRELFKDVVIVYGMRHSMDILFRQEFKILLRRKDMSVFIAAEEMEMVGPQLPPISMQLGRVTDLIQLSQIEAGYRAAICGPPIMYKYVIGELKKKGLLESDIYLSLERQMKCAVGKCGHCFVDGHFTCKEGPVFSLDQMRFMKEAIEVEGCEFSL